MRRRPTRVLGGWHDQAGYRGRFLGLLALGTVLYGSALIVARHSRGQAYWWPGYLSSLAGIKVEYWGVIWIAAGLFLATGIWRKRDDLQYMVATVLNAAWAVLVMNWWWKNRDLQAGSWALAVIWSSIATATYLVSLWPEPGDKP